VPSVAQISRGYFLGDYQGLAAAGNSFYALFAEAGSGSSDRRTSGSAIRRRRQRKALAKAQLRWSLLRPLRSIRNLSLGAAPSPGTLLASLDPKTRMLVSDHPSSINCRRSWKRSAPRQRRQLNRPSYPYPVAPRIPPMAAHFSMWFSRTGGTTFRSVRCKPGRGVLFCQAASSPAQLPGTTIVNLIRGFYAHENDALS